MPKIAVCSICSNNFFAQARVLFESVKRFHPDWDCHFLLADEANGSIDVSAECFLITEAKELGIPGFEKMAFRYDVIEMNVALKPFFIKNLLARGYDRVVYFDVDMKVFSSLTPILAALDSASIVITPHITTPLSEDVGRTIREDLFLKNGTYNLGFIAVSQCDETRAFLDWWSERCLTQCFREPETGLFVDQKWINLVPGLYARVNILRHRGCNMAYWNLHERRLTGLQVNGEEPLIFFHFSGLEISSIGNISKHQSRYTLDNRSDISALFHDYRESVLAAGNERFEGIPYGYGRFENGDPIGLIARRLYDSVAGDYPHPFAVGPGTYHERLRRRGLLTTNTSPAFGPTDAKKRGRPIELALTALARLLGIRRYEALMAYLRHISVIRRQKFLLG